MTNEQKNTLIRAINHFGVEHQIDKAIEEMGELITALARRRLDRSRKEDIAEEIADVLIVANQLRIIYGGELVDGLIDQKLSRLEATINGDWRRQERMMPKGMVKHREEEESEARKGSLIGECEDDLREKFERGVKETQERPDSAEIRRCCLFCKHIRVSVRDPFCGITLRDIIGEPRATCCGRFEPTLEKREGGNNE